MNAGFLAHWLTTAAALGMAARRAGRLGSSASSTPSSGPLLVLLTLPFTVLTLGLFDKTTGRSAVVDVHRHPDGRWG